MALKCCALIGNRSYASETIKISTMKALHIRYKDSICMCMRVREIEQSNKRMVFFMQEASCTSLRTVKPF